MCTDGADDELRQVLWSGVPVLEIGDGRRVLRPLEVEGRPVAGSRHLVLWATALRLVARSMQLQAQGRVHDAWLRLAEAAVLLHPQMRRFDDGEGVPRAVFAADPPDDAPVDEQLARRVARLVAREQFELDHLRQTFAHDRTAARDVLVEALTQHWFWVQFDGATWSRPQGSTGWDDDVVVDATRSALCGRATGLRQFADPTCGTPVSKSVWHDVGGFRGLYGEALSRLAEREVPAPWCGVAGTSGLKIRRARLRAWQHAHRWRDDQQLD